MKPLAQLWRARRLAFTLAARDLKLASRDKFLGMLWSVLDPLLMLGVYVALVGVFLDRGGDGFVPRLLCALLSWKWFAYSTQSSVVSVARQGGLIQAIRFPLMALPLAKVLVGLGRFGFALPVLFGVLVLTGMGPGAAILWLPAVLLVQLILTAGVALMVAAGGVFFRDLQNLLGFFLKVGFYLSPGLYLVDDVPARFQHLYRLNPFVGLFEGYQQVLVYGQAPPSSLGLAAATAALILAAGLVFFRRAVPTMAKAV